MRILLTINPSKDIYYQIKVAKSIGFDGVEIVLEDEALKIIEKEKENIKKFLEEIGMFASFHLPYWLDILKEDDFRKILELYEIVKYFNSFCVIHIFSEEEKDIEKYKKIVKNLSDKKIYFENLFQKTEYLEKLIKKVKNIKFAIDISHILTSNTSMNTFNFLEKFKDNIFHIHLSDGNGFSHSHLPFGKGVFPMRRIIEFLVQNFDDKTIAFEIFETEMPEIDFETSLNVFKEIVNKYGKRRNS